MNNTVNKTENCKSQAQTERKAPERKSALRSKRLITAGAVLTVILIAAIAGCTPQGNSDGSSGDAAMKEFVAQYEATQGPGDPNHLVTFHYNQGYECVDCHETPDTTDMGTKDTCFTSGCHDKKAIVAATDDYQGFAPSGRSSHFGELYTGVNPHRSHMDEVSVCGDCHSMHGQSVMSCNDCHYLPLPNGWSDAFDGAGAGMP